MPSDYFLKLAGITGESKDAKHKDEIELVAFSWGVTSQTVGGGGGGGRRPGKATLTDVEVAMPVTRAGPQLFLACASGQHIKDATLSVRRSGGKNQLEYLKYKFSDVLITSYQESGTPDQDRPVDVVRFAFGTIEMSYTEQKPDGSGGATTKVGWDLTQNKKI
jgi:type VI secretion system secreted protein Hcp